MARTHLPDIHPRCMVSLYLCSYSYEDDYLRGEAFEVSTWFDLKEIEGEKTIVLPPLHFSGHSNAV